MRNSTKTMSAVVLLAGLAVAPVLHAQESQDSDQTMQPSMMDGMMGQDGGMPMMQQMKEMMSDCNAMMEAMMARSEASSGDSEAGATKE